MLWITFATCLWMNKEKKKYRFILEKVNLLLKKRKTSFESDRFCGHEVGHILHMVCSEWVLEWKTLFSGTFLASTAHRRCPAVCTSHLFRHSHSVALSRRFFYTHTEDVSRRDTRPAGHIKHPVPLSSVESNMKLTDKLQCGIRSRHSRCLYGKRRQALWKNDYVCDHTLVSWYGIKMIPTRTHLSVAFADFFARRPAVRRLLCVYFSSLSRKGWGTRKIWKIWRKVRCDCFRSSVTHSDISKRDIIMLFICSNASF